MGENVIALAPVFEELLYRQRLLDPLRRRVGAAAAVTISSLLFAFPHLSPTRIAQTFVLTLTGLPVACVPAGLDPSGLPTGIQIVGPAHHEGAVLALAGRIERLRPVGHPPSTREPISGY